MTRMLLTIAAALVLIGCGSAPQLAIERIANTNYVVALALDSIPQYPPLRRLHNATSFPVAAGDKGFSIEIVFGRQSDSTWGAWLVIERKDGTVTLSQMTVFNGSVPKHPLVLAVSEPELESDSTGRYPFEARYFPDSSKVLYRWIWSRSPEIPAARYQALSVGKRLADTTFVDLAGRPIALARRGGKPLAICLWGRGCSPCLDEIDGLNELVSKFTKQGIEFMGVTKDERSQLEYFLNVRPFNYRQVLVNEETVQYFGEALPRNIIADGDGIVVYDHTGGSEKTSELLDPVLERLAGGAAK